MKNTCLVFIALFIGIAVTAQTDSTAAKQLGEVVVTGQYTPQSAKNSVYQVRVITRERILKQSATRLQDVLNTELNVRFSQDLATGGAGISMLGLSGQYVKVLIDGLPMVGRQGTSNEIDINQVDINSIERIEIIEGPMSVVYGADALAGVINIITKKSTSANFSVTARLHEESVGKEYGIREGIHNQYVGVNGRFRNWEAGGALGRNYFGGWKDTAAGRELLWHRKDQIIGHGFIGWHKGGFSVRYRIDGLDEIIADPGNFLSYSREADDTLAVDREYLTQRVMHQLQAAYVASADFSLQMQSSYTDFSRQVFSTTVSKKTGDIRLNTANGAQSIINFSGLTFRATAMYKFSPVVSIQPGVDVNRETGEGERLQQGSNGLTDFAFFVSSEIRPKAFLNIRPGLRVIKNSVYQAPPVIPSLNTKLLLGKQFDLRLAYARGFRAPSLRELYFNFFDANHQIKGNADLEAETSASFTGSLSWKPAITGDMLFTASLSAFSNDVKNLIDLGVSPADPNVFVYINVARYKSKGTALTGTLKHRNLNASLGVSYTGRFNRFSEEEKSLPEFRWSPEMTSTIGYAFPKAGLDVNLYFKYTGKLPYYQSVIVNNREIVQLAEIEGYAWSDLTINKKLFRHLTLSAGVRNLFNVINISNTAITGGVHSSAGDRPVGYGRSVFAGLAFNWDRKKGSIQ